ncbi:hypothetical protein BDV25DRAFT_134131 [Aspergillus avenaceus]|uniref:PAP-associated domain-containing protein n=1 Tax=Aspergillus avenaceus TaxID=36643 RepID=A0A5N6TFG2_ASPAV|nr:hypothetical protein BDV25DRAFT_134131 [Aspergillus avenaceus]
MSSNKDSMLPRTCEMLSHASNQLLPQQQKSSPANHRDCSTPHANITARSPLQRSESFHSDKPFTISCGRDYSYSHAPRTRFGDQQSDPYRQTQIQTNYLDSLAVRVPPFSSFTDELRSKVRLRILLTGLARGALDQYAKQHGYSSVGKAIDLKCYGSLRNGFILPDAHLDLVMATHATAFPKELETECPRILRRAFLDAGLGARLAQDPRAPTINIYETPSKELLEALKLEHNEHLSHHTHTTNLSIPTPGGARCEIIFCGRLVLYNTELLRCYALCDERVRLVGVFVKMWAKARKISNPYQGTLCSYGYILMVIHYLTNVANPPLVPNLQLLHHVPTGPDDTNSVEHTPFFNNETKLRGLALNNVKFGNRQTVGDLLRGFFAYYGSCGRAIPLGSFNWARDVVSIRTQGGILTKRAKCWNIPKTDESGHSLQFLMAIEDPIEHHNVGRTVTQRGLQAIKAEFTRAQEIIRKVQEIPGVGWEWRTKNGTQDFGTSYRVALDSRQFHGPDAIHMRDPTARAHLDLREPTTEIDPLPFSKKSLC